MGDHIRSCIAPGSCFPACFLQNYPVLMPSSVIKYCHYHEDRRVLRVGYQSGAVYDYLEVPEEVYLSMKAAFSKGTFLNRHIKGKYKFRKIA